MVKGREAGQEGESRRERDWTMGEGEEMEGGELLPGTSQSAPCANTPEPNYINHKAAIFNSGEHLELI